MTLLICMALLKNIMANTLVGGIPFGTIAGNAVFQGNGSLNTQAGNTDYPAITNTPIDAYMLIIWGQSNATGWLQTEASIPNYLQGELTYGQVWDYEKASWGNLQIGYNNNFGGQKIYPYFGPEMNLAYQLGQLFSRVIYVVKFTANGTSMQTYWKPSLGNGGYDILIQHIEDARANLEARGYVVHIPAMYSMQGESDAINDNTSANNYLANREAFATAIKNDLSLPNLVDCFGRIQNINTDPTRVATVRTAQATFAAADPVTRFMIDTDAYPTSDGTHFTGAGQVTHGLDAFNLIKEFY